MPHPNLTHTLTLVLTLTVAATLALSLSSQGAPTRTCPPHRRPALPLAAALTLSRLAQLSVPKVPPLCEMSSTHLGDIGEI